MTEPAREVRAQWGKMTEEMKTHLSPKEKKAAIDDFKAIDRPLTLPEVPATYNQVETQLQILSHTAGVLKGSLDSKQLTTMQRMGQKFNQLTRFAWNHPWLTAGILIALFLFAASSYLTVSALMGHTTLALFGAHPELGGAMAAMTLYYGVYLINMARRAALKDDLENRIESHNALQKKVVKGSDANVKQLVEKMNEEIMEIHHDQVKIHEEMVHIHTEMQKQYKSANTSLRKIQKAQEALKPYLPEELPVELMCPPLPEEFPLFPTLELETDTIEIPDHVTDQMIKNSKKGRCLQQKLTDFFGGIESFINDNPGSALLIFGGVGICLLGGVGAFLWFHGYSSFYFLGSLSAMTIVPLLIYGLSMIYEGYNSGTINELQRKLKEMDQNKEEIAEALEKERVRLQSITQYAQQTFQDFSQKWKEFHSVEREQHKRAQAQLSSLKVDQMHVLAGMIEVFQSLSHEVSPGEARRILSPIAEQFH